MNLSLKPIPWTWRWTMRSALPYGFLAMQVNVPLSDFAVSMMCSSDKYPPFTGVPFTSYLQTKGISGLSLEATNLFQQVPNFTPVNWLHNTLISHTVSLLKIVLLKISVDSFHMHGTYLNDLNYSCVSVNIIIPTSLGGNTEYSRSVATQIMFLADI